MADPLALLQEYAMNKRDLRELKYNGKLFYVFGEVAYPHDAKTNLGVYNKQDEYYSIESILLFWKMRDLQHTAYVRDVSGRGIASITRVQRRDLLDFLQGGALPKEANMLAPIPPPIPSAHLRQEQQQQQQQDEHGQLHQQQEQYQQQQYEPDRKKPRLEQQQQQQQMQDRKGHRIDKILNQDAAEVRGLSSALPAEKVALLRSRVKNNLKNKPLDDESLLAISEMSAPAQSSSGDVLGRIMAEKERVRKDRTTCLESQSRDFSGILTVLKDLQVRENQAKHAHQQQQQQAGGGTAGGPAATNGAHQQLNHPRSAQKAPSGYSRYDQEIFQRETVADFVIETDLSFHGNTLMQQQQQQKQLLASASHASSTATTPAAAGSSRERLQQLQQQHPQQLHQQRSAHPSPGAMSMGGSGQRHPPSHPHHHSQQQQQQQLQQQKRVSRTPIIVIPATGTALITMYNAQDILQDLRYVSSEEKKLVCKRDNELLLQIQKNGVTVPYRVIDNPLRLRDDEWDRVVAVFVQGPAWQFKGWKWNSNPVEIFANVAAFHLKFEEQKLDPNVAKWSVNVLQLSRSKRHLDRAILQKFWEILDRHISRSSKREWLRC